MEKKDTKRSIPLPTRALASASSALIADNRAALDCRDPETMERTLRGSVAHRSLVVVVVVTAVFRFFVSNLFFSPHNKKTAARHREEEARRERLFVSLLLGLSREQTLYFPLSCSFGSSF